MKWLTLVSAPIGAISSKNWIMIWVFLEFSSMSFILLSKNNSSSESLLKYFLIQTLGSIFIILTLSLNMKVNFNYMIPSMYFSPLMIIMSLMMKAGLAPIHFWMIQVSKNLSKKSLLLFLSVQKLAPLSIILMTSNILTISLIILVNSIIGTVSQLYSLNMNLILTFSSISHSSWIILSGMNSMNMLFLYFIIYTMIISQILLSKKNLEFKKANNLKNTIIMFMSLAGLPPLLGFIPKWLSLSICMHNKNMKITCFIMMIMACLNVFIYFRIFSIFITKTPNLKNKNMESPLNFWNKFINFSPLILFLMPKF